MRNKEVEDYKKKIRKSKKRVKNKSFFFGSGQVSPMYKKLRSKQEKKYRIHT